MDAYVERLVAVHSSLLTRAEYSEAQKRGIKRGIIDNKDKDIRKVINKALADTGETRQGLYTDPARFDKVIAHAQELSAVLPAVQKENAKTTLNQSGWLQLERPR